MLLNYETRITILIFNLKFFAFFCFGSSSDASAAYVIVPLNTIWGAIAFDWWIKGEQKYTDARMKIVVMSQTTNLHIAVSPLSQ